MSKVATVDYEDVESMSKQVSPEEAPPGALSRSLSMKDHAKAAGSHYMQHKFKYIAAKVVVVAAIVLGCIFGIIKILALNGKAGSAAALIAGKAGTTIPSVSALPAKKQSSSRRRLVGSGNIIHDAHAHMLRGLSTVLNSPSSFDATADYNTFGATNLVVGDKAVDSVQTINMIGCLTKQMRAMDVGLNAAYNPSSKPYVAIVDSSICGSSGGSGIQTWAISVKGPAALGDGTYSSLAAFNGFGGIMHVSFVNTVLNSTLLKSQVDFSKSSGGQISFQGGLDIDYSNPALTDVIFMQKNAGQTTASYLHASFNPITFVGGVVSTGDGSTLYALDFNNAAINRRTKVGSTTTSVCFDYSPSKMIFAGEQYTLFNANDGSRKQLVQGYSGTFSKSGVTAPVYIGYWGLYTQDVFSADGKTTLVSADQVKAAITDGSAISIQQADGSLADQKIQRVNAVLQKTSTQTSTLAKLKGVPLQVWSGSGSDTVAWDGTQFVRVAQDSYMCVYSDGSNQAGSVTAVKVDSSISLATQMDAQAHCLCLDPDSPNIATSGYTLKTTGSSAANPWDSAGFLPLSKTKLLDGKEVYPVTAAKFQWGMNIYSGRMSGRVNLPFDNTQMLSGVSFRHYTQGYKISQPSTGATGTVYKDTAPNLYGLVGNTVTFHATITTAGVMTVLTSSGTDSGTVGAGARFSYSVGSNNYYPQIKSGSGSTFQLCTNCCNSVSSSPCIENVFAAVTSSTQYSYTYYFTATSAQYPYSDQDGSMSCATPAPITAQQTYLMSGMLLTQGTVSAAVSGTLTSGWSGYGGLAVSMTKSGTSFTTTGGALSISVGTAGSYFQGLTALTGSISFSTGGGLDTSYSSGPPGVMLSYDTTKCPAYGYWTALPLKKDEMVTSGSDANGVLKVSAITGGSVTGADITINTWSSGSYVSIDSAGSACSQTDTAGIVVTLDCGSNVGAAQVAFKCTNRVDASSNQVQVTMTSSAQFSAATSKPIYMTDAAGTASTKVEISDPFWHGIWWTQQQQGDLQAVTDATTVSFQAQTNVQATDSVPAELWCYDNCPVGAGDAASSLSLYPSAKTLSSVQVSSGGSCAAVSGNPPSASTGLTFAGFLIGLQPTYTLSWTANSDNTFFSLSSVTITDPGVIDSSADSQTVSFTASCATAPAMGSLSTNYGDYKDFRAARKYSFDALSGKLTDKSNGQKVMNSGSGGSSYGGSYGPFFAGTASNMAALLCVWSASYVCSYQAYNLPETYSYRTSSSDSRISLLDSANKVLPFDAPLTAQYTHSGTASNSGRLYDGKTLLLTYNGPGDLQGLPQVCVDPVTSSVADCVTDGRLADATSNFADITLSPTIALSDLNGNRYYALAQQATQYFPKATDQTLCSSLTFAALPSVPDFASVFTAPSSANDPFPTDLSGYLNGGKPAVIKGVTFYEALQK